MDTAQFKRMEELFDRAMDLPPEQRHAFLQEACGPDLELLGQNRGCADPEQQQKENDETNFRHVFLPFQ